MFSALLIKLCYGRHPRALTKTDSTDVGKPLPPPLTGEQYGKMETKYPEGGHCQNVLRPPLFLLIQWRRQRHLTWYPPTML